MEIVTESDLRSAEEAYAYLTRLRSIVRYLGVSTGNMEEGAMRCEVNISLRPRGTQEYGTKVEVKNLNSFRSVRLAIEYEMGRQARLLDSGGRVEQVTMGWDERSRCTQFQRSKEEAQDYRYFPEPDLPPLTPSREWVASLRATLPELPEAKRARFMEIYGLRGEEAALLVEDAAVADYFEAAVRAATVPAQIVANWIVGEVTRLQRETGKDLAASALAPELLAELLGLVAAGEINATVGKDILAEVFRTGERPSAVVARRGLGQIRGDERLREIVRQAIAANPRAVADYGAGKSAALQYLVGQVMRLTRGQADAQAAEALLRQELGTPRD